MLLDTHYTSLFLWYVALSPPSSCTVTFLRNLKMQLYDIMEIRKEMRCHSAHTLAASSIISITYYLYLYRLVSFWRILVFNKWLAPDPNWNCYWVFKNLVQRYFYLFTRTAKKLDGSASLCLKSEGGNNLLSNLNNARLCNRMEKSLAVLLAASCYSWCAYEVRWELECQSKLVRLEGLQWMSAVLWC